MDIKTLKLVATSLANSKPNEVSKLWNMTLQKLEVSHSQLVKALSDALNKTGESLGLTEKELLALADNLKISTLNKEIFKKLSPNAKEQRADLNEAALRAAVTEFLTLSESDQDRFLSLLRLTKNSFLEQVSRVISEGNEMGLSKEELKKLFGESFTSTANVAAYPVPLGSMLRRGKSKKKKA